MNSTNDQFMVHYSVSFGDPARADSLARQLQASLTTLRATNPDLHVVVFMHGSLPEQVETMVRRHGAEIVQLPDPVERLRADMGELGAIIGRFLPIHKFLNLRALAEIAPADTLHLDADTIVFGDFTHLIPDGDRPCFVAREEVGSLRCRFGPDPDYLDELGLASSVSAVGGAEPAPAFNTGVMLFHRFPWDRARSFERRYLSWIARFAIWMADRPADPAAPQYADVFDVESIRRLLAGPEAARVRRLGVRYPSKNRWLAEEAAAWIAVGYEREAGDMTVERFHSDDVAQGGEPLEGPLPHFVWHYFNSNQDGMRRRLRLDTYASR